MVNLTIAPAYMAKVSKPWQSEGILRQASRLHELRRQNVESREKKAARVHRID